MKKLKFLSLLMVLMLIVSACGPQGDSATDSADEADTAAEANTAEGAEEEEAKLDVVTGVGTVTSDEDANLAQLGESPILAEMVAAGALPPVEERLPVAEDIRVVEPVEEVGQYGGTWFAVTSDNNLGTIKMKIYDPPVRWKADYSGYEPGLLKSYGWSEDGTEITWTFRRGVRWSDGTPFTMEDMQFWWEDLATNEDYKVINVPWWGFKSDGTPMDVEFPNEYTMVMRWDHPQWITPFIVAQGFWEWEPLMKPKHYLSQFHPNYNEEATYEDVELMDKWVENPDYPVLFAWKVESHTPGERTVFTRNPFYWKTDTEGNQLPYIDKIDVEIIEDEEVRVLNMSQGKYDATFRGTADPVIIPFLIEQAEADGSFYVADWVVGSGGFIVFMVNQGYNGDEPNAAEIRALLRDTNFRKGLSHAMDRQRIIDVVLGGIGNPQQMTISPQAWHFQSSEGQEVLKAWEQADATYDVDLANELLDAAGMTERDAEGYRTLPNGDAFTLVIDVSSFGGGNRTPVASEAYAAQLDEVGIRVVLNNVIGTPEDTLRQNEGLFMLRTGGTSEMDIWTYPDWIFPTRSNRAFPTVGKWRQTGGAEGEAPEPGSPAEMLLEIYDAGLAEPDVNKRHELVWDAIQIHIEEGPFSIGVVGDQIYPVVIKNHFRNVPRIGILGPWAPGSPGNKNPEQFFIEQE